MDDTILPLSDDAPLSAIEAIVLPVGRPAIVVSHGTFSTPDGPWSILERSRLLIEGALRSVCLISLAGPPSSPTVGTGFLVGKNLLLTTRRVASAFCDGVGREGLRLSQGVFATADFTAEGSDRDEGQQLAAIVAAELIHPVLDIALLRLEEGTHPLPLELSATKMPHADHRRVVTLGVVSLDVSTAPAEGAILSSILGESGPRKRILPGQLMALEVISSYGGRVWAVTHDCTTTATTAGAPIIDLETGRVVAIHLSGGYLERNYAILTSDIVRDARVIEAGLQADGDVNPSLSAWSTEWEAADPPSAAERVAHRPPPLARDGSANVDRFDRLVRTQFRSVADFVQLLQSLGDAYASVVNAVPQRGSDDCYRTELVQSLERRRLLDETLEAAITGRVTRNTLEAHSAILDPSMEMEAVPQDHDGSKSRMTASTDCSRRPHSAS